MTRSVLPLLFMLWFTPATAQEGHTWERYLNTLMTQEDASSEAWETAYDQLCELEQHPIDINKATREELEQLHFLSAQAVEGLMAYRDRYGPLKSKAELLMITQLDYECRQLLNCIIFIGDETANERLSLSDLTRYARQELTANLRIPFYHRENADKQTGYQLRHWLRYQLTSRDRLKLGIVGSQDAGEPFFSGRNSLGYDYYSLYLQLQRLGPVERLVVGNYRVSLGMGLVINNGFSLGKLSVLQNLGRTPTALRAHSSRSAANYLQGAAATISLSRRLSLTAFGSYQAIDATLNPDGSASSIVTSGYHRTPAEMQKKNNTHQTTAGGSLQYRSHGFHGGLNAVYTHLDRRLQPSTIQLYRRYYATGSDFLNVSADYGYAHPRFSLNGETAVNRDGQLATINSASMQLMDGSLSLLLLQRFYSYRYTSLHARSYSDGGRIQNESGVYLGATYQPSPVFQLKAYADVSYAPWARYQASQASWSHDYMAQASWHTGRWSLGGRYRLRRRQRDNEKEQLQWFTEHRGRLTAEWADGQWNLRTQVDGGLTARLKTERGVMVSQQVDYRYRWLRARFGMGYFATEGYDSRIYLFEPSPLYNYGVQQYQGHGWRTWLMTQAMIASQWSLTAKLGVTGRHPDLDIQLRWII